MSENEEWMTPGLAFILDESFGEGPTIIKQDSNVLTIEDFYCNIEIEAKDKPDKNTLAKKYLNLIGQGYKPGEAAKLVGTSMSGIASDNKTKKQLERLAKDYQLSADVRRALVRMGMNKILLDNIDSTDVNNQKLALDAAKAIGSDTEVGINAPPQPGIQINVGNLQGLFSAIEIPKEEIIDVDFTRSNLGEIRKDDSERTFAVDGIETQILDEAGIKELIQQTREENDKDGFES